MGRGNIFNGKLNVSAALKLTVLRYLAVAICLSVGAPACDAGFAQAYRFVSDTPPPRLPFSGADIVARGVLPSQRVGDVLKTLQVLWIKAGFPREPEALARLLDEALNG